MNSKYCFMGLPVLLLTGLAQAKSCEWTFSLTDAGARSVWVSGSFTDWAGRPESGAVAMTRMGDTWTAQVALPEGRNLYKFIVDGRRWVSDPHALAYEPDPYGSQNAVLQCGSETSVTQSLPQCGDPEALDWRDSVLYFAMIDRFYDSDGRKAPVPGATGGDGLRGPTAQYEGGDFRGVTQKIGYLSDLGVTALWLSAPFENRNETGRSIYPDRDSNLYAAYHGYWPSPDDIDFSDPNNPRPRPRVESRFGTEQDLKDLIAAAHGAPSAHGQGILVLFDYVMKHVDINSGLYRSRPDWFPTFNGRLRVCGPENLWDDPYWTTRCSFTDYLPSFDFYNPQVRQWSIHDALWWAKEFNIDGLRLDAVKHIPIEWLNELRSGIQREFPAPRGNRFYLVGETFDYFNREGLKRFVDSKNLLDGQFDFPFKLQACTNLFGVDGDMGSFATWLASNDRYYDRGPNNRSLMVTWIGNHDVPRAIHFASRQITTCTMGSLPENAWSPSQYQQPQDAAPYERLGVAFAVMLTSPGIPLIYYGDEIGLAGGGDPDNRRMMPWDARQLNVHQFALRDKVRKLAKLRGALKIFGRGQRRTTFVDRDAWVYTMGGCDSLAQVTVAINKSDSWKTVPLPGQLFEDLLEGGQVSDRNLSIPPRSFRVLKAI
jgi:glycosidase